MKLITEYIDYNNLEFIAENNNEKIKTFRIKGPFMQAEVKNRNGRIYDKTILEREVSLFNEEKIKENRALGSLDHPNSPTVTLADASHLIEELNMVGNDGIGVARILSTPKGRIAKDLIESGVKLGVSTRGIGTLTGNKVNKDFKLITVDLVADPSAPNAFVEGILENKEYIIENNRIIEVDFEKIEKKLHNNSKDIKSVLNDFLKLLNQNI